MNGRDQHLRWQSLEGQDVYSAQRQTLRGDGFSLSAGRSWRSNSTTQVAAILNLWSVLG